MHLIGFGHSTRDQWSACLSAKKETGSNVAEYVRADTHAAVVVERNAALAQAEQMRNALIEHNDLLRSAFQIADREGVKQMVATTNWDAFYNRVTVVLKRHHAATNAARAALLAMKGTDHD